MRRSKLTFAFTAVICFAACSSVSHPETKLLGKWQTSDEKPASKKVTHQLYFQDQYEFFADGSAAHMQKERRSKDGRWEQAGTGTFKFVDQRTSKLTWVSCFMELQFMRSVGKTTTISAFVQAMT